MKKYWELVIYIMIIHKIKFHIVIKYINHAYIN